MNAENLLNLCRKLFGDYRTRVRKQQYNINLNKFCKNENTKTESRKIRAKTNNSISMEMHTEKITACV